MDLLILKKRRRAVFKIAGNRKILLLRTEYGASKKDRGKFLPKLSPRETFPWYRRSPQQNTTARYREPKEFRAQEQCRIDMAQQLLGPPHSTPSIQLTRFR